MHRGLTQLVASWSLLLSAVLVSATPAGAAAAPATLPNFRSVTDPAGDVVDAEGADFDDPRGDILQASADYKADGIHFEVRLARITDPVQDRNWNSDSSYLSWLLDTTGDSNGDFTVEYGLQNDRLYAAVFRVAAPDEAPAVCNAQEVFVGKAGYGLRLDPACIGRPDSVAWSVEASYDTNPRDEEAPATEDLAPDTGLAPPVRAPAGAQRTQAGGTSSATGVGQGPSGSGAGAAAAQGGSHTAAAATATVADAAGSPTHSASSAGSSGGQEQGAAAGASAKASAKASSSTTAGSPTSGRAAGQRADGAQPAAVPPDGRAEDMAAASDARSTIPPAVIAVAASLPLVLVGILWMVLRSRRPATVEEF